MPVLNFSGVKELEAVPAGEYLATIADVKWNAKPKNGSEHGYYAVKFTIADDDSDYKGRSVYKNFSVKPDALFATKQCMIAAGVDADKFAGDVDLDEEWAELKGAEVVVVVSTREYNDKIQSQVDRIREPDL